MSFHSLCWTRHRCLETSRNCVLGVQSLTRRIFMVFKKKHIPSNDRGIGRQVKKSWLGKQNDCSEIRGGNLQTRGCFHFQIQRQPVNKLPRDCFSIQDQALTQDSCDPLQYCPFFSIKEYEHDSCPQFTGGISQALHRAGQSQVYSPSFTCPLNVHQGTGALERKSWQSQEMEYIFMESGRWPSFEVQSDQEPKEVRLNQVCIYKTSGLGKWLIGGVCA